ncbi:MAG: site-specific integrase, partial [Chthoniobacterales bacterium]
MRKGHSAPRQRGLDRATTPRRADGAEKVAGFAPLTGQTRLVSDRAGRRRSPLPRVPRLPRGRTQRFAPHGRELHRALEAAAAALSPKGWREAGPDDFRAYLFALMKRDKARATIRLDFAALRSFYRFLCERKG